MTTATLAKPTQTTLPEVKDAAALLRQSGEQFGQNLPENKPMIVYAWDTQPIHFAASNGRPERDGTQINLDMAMESDPDKTIRDYHCFSTVLLRQLNTIGVENLPVLVIAGGRGLGLTLAEHHAIAALVVAGASPPAEQQVA